MNLSIMKLASKSLNKKILLFSILLSFFILDGCNKENDTNDYNSEAVSGSIIINGKTYKLMPSDILEITGGWSLGQGTLYIWWLDERGDGWLETFKFQSSQAPQVGDDLAQMSLKHLPGNELFDRSETAQKTWPNDWITHDYLRGDYVSGSLIVVNIEKGYNDGYITVKFDNLKTRNYICEVYFQWDSKSRI